MDDRQFWISGVVMAVLACLADFGINGVLLYDDYAALEGTLFRTPKEVEGYFIYMAVAYLLFGFALTWIYRQGKTKGAGTLAQGIRFGGGDRGARGGASLSHLLRRPAHARRARGQADRVRLDRGRASRHHRRLSEPQARRGVTLIIRQRRTGHVPTGDIDVAACLSHPARPSATRPGRFSSESGTRNCCR